MNDKMKKAFDQIHAEDELKQSTMEYIRRIAQTQEKPKTRAYRYIVPALACLVFLIVGSFVYLTPTANISIDINPSIELGVNRFDRVVSVKSYNDDGKELKAQLDIKNMKITKAVEQVMANDTIEALLSKDEILTIGVIGNDKEKSEKILSEVEACTEKQKNTYCYSASTQEVEGAHETGLSCGKYKAYLELHSLDGSITAEDVRNMTMREIRDLISRLSSDSGTDPQFSGNGGQQSSDCTESEHNGSHSGKGQHGKNNKKSEK